MLLDKILRVKTEKSGVVRILTEDTPASLDIDGSDVSGLPDDYVIEVGSMIVTPDADYICFSVTDGKSNFIQKYNTAPNP